MTMPDVRKIIGTYYEAGSELEHVLIVHSEQVAQMAMEVCARLKNRGVEVDEEFVWESAMLHDIGIIRVDAPSIYCHGTEPYIKHGVLGREMLDALGLPRHALVCERHTGSGLTCEDIVSRGLPLPHRDLVPVSTEERIVCYADKFFSKSHLGDAAKSVERVRAQMAAFGEASLARFDRLHAEFGA